MQREFADISGYTSRFSAHAYASAGHTLIAVKATEGESYVSPRYSEQAAHAHEAGLDVWHYHFARPDTDPAAVGEAAHFWSTVRPHYQPGDHLVLDVETVPDTGAAGLVPYTTQLAQRLTHISGIHPAVYTYDSLFREVGAGWQVPSGDWWIARYDGSPARLGAGRRMVAWQRNDGSAGSGTKRWPGIDVADGNLLPFWYARRLARDRARRGKAVH